MRNDNHPTPVATKEGDDDDGDAVYVNELQYKRILHRRATRAKLAQKPRPYTQESRSLHAISRIRGPSGRFISSDEIDALKATGRLSATNQILPDPSATAQISFSEMNTHQRALMRLDQELSQKRVVHRQGAINY